MNRLRRGALLGLMLAALAGAGCMGPGPVERSLLVRSPCSQTGAPMVTHAPVLAVLPFEASAALDRRAVAVQEGQVLRSATTWMWEDSPRRLVTQAVMDQLACSGAWRVLWPYRPRAEHAAVLGGRVEEFSVTLGAGADGAGGVVRIALVAEVWSRNKGPLLGRLPLEATVACADNSPQAAAVAASEAMGHIMLQLEQGLRSLRPHMEAGHE
ncbi:ABC-type transport auxiliary lipoprotein family protein [Megalodesulfovibrio gigas]|uniref:ABC-type transport auxiliary lipoprotein component domain-containing protein n=1 Tax=Megalodesulfovibrio gigas (strain ATCC 19364 / DSM 1382 / NCIMB 9332 / VKM B-1759) TaxID=1121448 RepID=T2G8X7_MEGG1|nr:ABC-type transport auxiliary lipoprotein family protein [Megalodesulfovibrio gigas]AGW12748.1 putative protein of unknown function DUF330 [Megalodesulfovibrio gigas DSM 1382 = ATCC 19364]